MGIKRVSKEVIFAALPPEPEISKELESIMQKTDEGCDCDIAVDFSDVDIVTSSSLSKLLKLRKLLVDRNHRLVCCNLAAATRGIFTLTGLDGVFEFADSSFISRMVRPFDDVAQGGQAHHEQVCDVSVNR